MNDLVAQEMISALREYAFNRLKWNWSSAFKFWKKFYSNYYLHMEIFQC